MHCSEDGCEKKVQARGLCHQHYKAWQRAGKPEGPALAARVQSTCDVPSCAAPAYSRSSCERHYRQARRTGGTLPDPVGPALCAVSDCERVAEARGWCHGHYLRWSRSGTVDAARPLQRAEATWCSAQGCDRVHLAQGYCLAHYQRLSTTGAVRDEVPLRQIAGTGYVQRGYVIVPVSPPERWLVGGATSAAQHRLVMARALGRPLTADESVHHRNGDRGCNELHNLELWSRYQPSGQRVTDKVEWALTLLSRYAPHLLAGARDARPRTADPGRAAADAG